MKMEDSELAEMYRRALKRDVIPIETKKRKVAVCAKCGNIHTGKKELTDCSLAWFYTDGKKPVYTSKNGIPVYSVIKKKRPEPPQKWKLTIPQKPRKKWQPARRPESYRMDSTVYYLIEEWGHVCSYCGRIDLRLTADHVIPKSRPGGAQLRGMGHNNMVPACQRCNGLKGAKTPLEWLMEGVLR